MFVKSQNFGFGQMSNFVTYTTPDDRFGQIWNTPFMPNLYCSPEKGWLGTSKQKLGMNYTSLLVAKIFVWLK